MTATLSVLGVQERLILVEEIAVERSAVGIEGGVVSGVGGM